MSARKKRSELGKVEAAISAQEGLRGIVPDAQIDAVLRALHEKRAALRAEVAGSVSASASSVAAGRDVVAGAVITGRVEGNVYIGPPTDDPEQALRIYREVLVSTCSDVPLRAVDVAAADASGRQTGMDLAAIYVDLDTTTQVSEKSPQKGHPRLPREETRPLRATEAAAQHTKLVFLGDPGSGKSTFLNYLTRCLAADALEPKAGWRQRLTGWQRATKGLVPILVFLRDFARALPAGTHAASPAQIWDFIVARLREQNLAFAEKPILEALDAGRALVLLDGLDEVPTDALRARVRDSAAKFIERHKASRFIVTCRKLSYQDPAWQLAELPSFTLAPFDDAKIARFIDAWHAELGRRNVLSPQDGADLTARLHEAVKRPDLARLAPNPLLLTAMAVVHTSRGRLPDGRARLYEETVDLLLWHREELKTRRLRDLLSAVGLADMDLKRVLSRVAFEAHSAVPEGDDESLSGIEEHRIEAAFAALHPEKRGRDWAHDVVDAMKLRAGLLLERSPGVYTFPHRTYQEYLAGVHLSVQESFTRTATELACRGAQWREVILLAVGRLVHVAGNTDRPLALVAELCPARVADTDVAWRNAWLAGEVLVEVGLHRIEGSQLGADMAERVPSRLVDLLQRGRLTPVERAKAGDVLGRLGDPRFDEEMWCLPKGDMLGFVEVPSGKFWIGSDKLRDQHADDDEMPCHEVELPTYWVGKYPVTVAQFRTFLEDTGNAPADPDALRGMPNHPVTWVRWEEATSYGAWLTTKLRDSDRTPSKLRALLREGRVRLPSEAEWEKAARGTDGRIYPWGDTADAAKANYVDTGIGNTSAVGCFSAGGSPYGCEEMSGNVWEWTGSRFLSYPYKAVSVSDNVAKGTTGRRVVRGGAFLSDGRFVRCAVRLNNLSVRDTGFRVVLSPSL